MSMPECYRDNPDPRRDPSLLLQKPTDVLWELRIGPFNATGHVHLTLLNEGCVRSRGRNVSAV